MLVVSYNVGIMISGRTYEIVEVLGTLPPEKIDEVIDFAMFLKARYGTDLPIDESDEWTEEDMHDATTASLEYGYRSSGEVD